MLAAGATGCCTTLPSIERAPEKEADSDLFVLLQVAYTVTAAPAGATEGSPEPKQALILEQQAGFTFEWGANGESCRIS